MRSSKDQKTVIKQQPGPSPTVTKESGMFLMSGYSEMGQHIIPIINKGPQEFFYKRKKREDGFKYAHNKSCVVYSSQEAFYPGGEEHPSTSVVGDII